MGDNKVQNAPATDGPPPAPSYTDAVSNDTTNAPQPAYPQQAYPQQQYTQYGNSSIAFSAAGPPYASPNAVYYQNPQTVTMTTGNAGAAASAGADVAVLVWSIITCICCNIILGIIAIVFSTMAMSSTGRREAAAARRHRMVAIVLNIVSIVLAVILVIVLVVYFTVIVNNIRAAFTDTCYRLSSYSRYDYYSNSIVYRYYSRAYTC